MATKTNAVRLVQQAKIACREFEYEFDENEQAEFREILFGGENARNEGPMYDAEAVEMVESEPEPDETEDEED